MTRATGRGTIKAQAWTHAVTLGRQSIIGDIVRTFSSTLFHFQHFICLSLGSFSRFSTTFTYLLLPSFYPHQTSMSVEFVAHGKFETTHSLALHHLSVFFYGIFPSGIICGSLIHCNCKHGSIHSSEFYGYFVGGRKCRAGCRALRHRHHIFQGNRTDPHC